MFQLKVRLEGIEPEIWRRIVIPASSTLADLHAVIQGAMGWQDSHLHMFVIEGKRYEVPDDSGFGSDAESYDESLYELGDLTSIGTAFSYIYDFGDDWKHEVLVEDEVEAQDREQDPKCTAGERACPPEDSGGPYGYPEFLEALTDPAHPDHEDRVDWANGFEPEAFNVQQANNLIGAVCALYRER